MERSADTRTAETLSGDRADGSAKWAFIFRWRQNRARPGAGKLREMGLGSAIAVPLKRARGKGDRPARSWRPDGKDPIAARKAEASIPTFGEIADLVIAQKDAESRSFAPARNRTKRALEIRGGAEAAARRSVDTAAVLAALKPIWAAKPETAHKTQGAIRKCSARRRPPATGRGREPGLAQPPRQTAG